ncbi:hypothetical protein [Mesorhizobium sp. M0006]|uniref:hypothetical protein n=1 Tax=Mesorhizobium sp. M0006 TaxID=2956838 RepID=UPI00333DD37B
MALPLPRESVIATSPACHGRFRLSATTVLSPKLFAEPSGHYPPPLKVVGKQRNRIVNLLEAGSEVSIQKQPLSCQLDLAVLTINQANAELNQ